jgi:hypothetical protein
MSDFLEDVELRNATVVLDPAKAPPKIEPEEKQKFTLPAVLPGPADALKRQRADGVAA